MTEEQTVSLTLLVGNRAWTVEALAKSDSTVAVTTALPIAYALLKRSLQETLWDELSSLRAARPKRGR